jgi:hypothetical protein
VTCRPSRRSMQQGWSDMKKGLHKKLWHCMEVMSLCNCPGNLLPTPCPSPCKDRCYMLPPLLAGPHSSARWQICHKKRLSSCSAHFALSAFGPRSHSCPVGMQQRPAEVWLQRRPIHRRTVAYLLTVFGLSFNLPQSGGVVTNAGPAMLVEFWAAALLPLRSSSGESRQDLRCYTR